MKMWKNIFLLKMAEAAPPTIKKDPNNMMQNIITR